MLKMTFSFQYSLNSNEEGEKKQKKVIFMENPVLGDSLIHPLHCCTIGFYGGFFVVNIGLKLNCVRISRAIYYIGVYYIRARL